MIFLYLNRKLANTSLVPEVTACPEKPYAGINSVPAGREVIHERNDQKNN
jgi:hypothetical protein